MDNAFPGSGSEEHGAIPPAESHGKLTEHVSDRKVNRRKRITAVNRILTLIIVAVIMFSTGIGTGYMLWGQQKETAADHASHTSQDTSAIAKAINPPEGYDMQVKFEDVGPKLIAAGAINLEPFKQVYQQSGDPLSDADLKILTTGGADSVRITPQNAHFLLNFFWALGLANKNPILDTGPIQQQSKGQIEGFASTGGWSLANKPIKEIFSGAVIIPLNTAQQARLEEVAKAVYRPCCDNPTHFPDCNHGMAMLGLLELMASQNATTDQMFKAAKYANAYWYPQQTMEQAVFFQANMKQDYQNVDARMLLSAQYSSISGFQAVHQYLSQNGYLNQNSQGGNSCGV